MIQRIILIAALFGSYLSHAQTSRLASDSLPDSLVVSDLGLFPKRFEWSKGKMYVNGFYRFFATYTQQNLPYALTSAPGDTVLPRSLFIGDDAQLPNLWLNIGGSTAGGARWGCDLRVFQFLNGQIGPSYGKQVPDSLRPNIQYPLGGIPLGGNLGTMLGGTMYGDFKTRFGQWSASVGGIQWVNISDLTMASFRGYNRFMLFERNPWDPMGSNVVNRYEQYFAQGSIDQDARWGNRAFQGLVLSGNAIPGGWNALFILGKTEVNGGFSTIPNFSYGGKIAKQTGKSGTLSFNSISQLSYTDSLARERYGLHVFTIEANQRFGWLQFRGEAGAGSYFSPSHHAGFEGLMQFKLSNVAKGNQPVIELHAFRVGANIVNNAALYWNTSVREYRVNDIPAGSVGSSAVLQPFGSSMIRVGQLTNNRQGLNLNVQLDRKRWKISGGVGSSMELQPSAAIITVGHPVNQFTRSRFWRWNFPANVGPYQRYSDIYRDVYQSVHLSDDSMGVVVNRKFFNAMEVQIKHQGLIAGHEFFFFALLQANSSSRRWSPITVFNERAYVRQYASEFEVFSRITKRLMLSGYFGIERTLGNYLTDIDEDSRRPMNQYGRGIGAGCDVELSKGTRLYVRHRWYAFEDRSFALDQFEGREWVVELKAFF
jgi:hypothetical protein